MNLIAHYRRKAKSSQADLAHKLGWIKSRLGNYETGYRSPGIDEARAIAVALSEMLGEPVTLDDLFPTDQQDAA